MWSVRVRVLGALVTPHLEQVPPVPLPVVVPVPVPVVVPVRVPVRVRVVPALMTSRCQH